MARKRFGSSMGPDAPETNFVDGNTPVHVHDSRHDVQGEKSLPWLEGAPDSYDDEDERLVPRSWLVGGLAAFLLLLAVSVFFIYKHVGGRNAGEEVAGNVDPSKLPLIEALKGPIKTQPNDPGGMKVPNQDLQAYNVASGETKTEATKLGQAAEQPLPRPAVPVAILPTAQIQSAKPQTHVEPKPAEPKAETKIAQAIPAPTIEKPVHKAPAAKPAPEPVVEEPEAPVKAASSGGVYVQLGAFSTRDRATVAWNKASADYTELKGQHHSLQVAGPDKIRLRVGPVSRAEADSMCASLKQQGQACLIAK